MSSKQAGQLMSPAMSHYLHSGGSSHRQLRGLARIIVSIQMLLDLVILGSVVRLLLNAAQIGLTRARNPSDQP
jgi:hypothetical protein